MYSPQIAVVTRETRLKGLLARWGTKGAAKFRLSATRAHERELRNANQRRDQRVITSTPIQTNEAEVAAEFAEYEDEDSVYREAIDVLNNELSSGFVITHVEREFLANYDFRGCVAVVVVGQDGLVANTAKYVGDVPIIAVNPDPQRIDGVLLPYQARQVGQVVKQLLKGNCSIREVTLAEAELNDGQRLLAFNDLFVGCSSHASARYTLTVEGRTEPQSSSGLIISTGAGSTGWLSSMFNMFNGMATWVNRSSSHLPNNEATENQGEHGSTCRLEWEDPRLAWVVREPFRSKQSGVSLVAGMLHDGAELVIESLMPSRGVIFSDGVESDFLEFSSGSIARVRRAAQRARLVFPQTNGRD